MSLGLPGPGVNQFLKEVQYSELWKFKRPLGISVGGDNKDEYINNIERIENAIKEKQINYFYELKYKLPNTKNGATICQRPDILESLLLRLRHFLNKGHFDQSITGCFK